MTALKMSLKGCDKMNEKIQEKKDINKILGEQLQLLAEESKEHRNEPDSLTNMSLAMVDIAKILLDNSNCFGY